MVCKDCPHYDAAYGYCRKRKEKRPPWGKCPDVEVYGTA